MLTNIPQLSGVGSNHSFANLKKFSLPSELKKKKKRKEKKVEKNAQVARIACILIGGTSIDLTPNPQSRNFKKCTASSWENFRRDIESGKVKDLER